MKKVGFLVSGNGGTLKFIHLIQKLLSIPFDIVFVIGDRPCGAIEYAKENHLENHVIEYKSTSNENLLNILKTHSEIDIIVTNIHKIIDPVTLRSFEGKFMNLHYSLLPAYAGTIGMKTVLKAKDDNTQFIGATCHQVNENLDGGKILSQSSFAVDWDEDFDVICHKLFVSANFCLLNSLIQVLEILMGTKVVYEHEGVRYNPPLPFRPDALSYEFWKEVAR